MDIMGLKVFKAFSLIKYFKMTTNLYINMINCKIKYEKMVIII